MMRTQWGYRIGTSDHFLNRNGEELTEAQARTMGRLPGYALIARDVSPTRVVSIR